ncbi:uncharacterized protein MONOS_10412 [Monocercomonoides exilis]|uniref:uncharacterized protein n=1 Tax=Monocercomonoides exilis TaxID=2049356 RepID=UPI00355A6182|nr:hypothetical protein MONOS_10412 [Monocercomonoides exilis]|eukprot:MONOS_10412.1-p1 / transcript=MONOS_10412.1 / gene=MONOS_10412 / organism=Monocercomonoides_exilis_PA203 / gene_product=unspecified product / transcript_product=unspecified product / location=Mono_scaffold00473:23878-27033(-) / protein_length=1034 / sequence_SO=supercontig / SO=protein_coding / is_pseudo=false
MNQPPSQKGCLENNENQQYPKTDKVDFDFCIPTFTQLPSISTEHAIPFFKDDVILDQFDFTLPFDYNGEKKRVPFFAQLSIFDVGIIPSVHQSADLTHQTDNQIGGESSLANEKKTSFEIMQEQQYTFLMKLVVEELCTCINQYIEGYNTSSRSLGSLSQSYDPFFISPAAIRKHQTPCSIPLLSSEDVNSLCQSCVEMMLHFLSVKKYYNNKAKAQFHLPSQLDSSSSYTSPPASPPPLGSSHSFSSPAEIRSSSPTGFSDSDGRRPSVTRILSIIQAYFPLLHIAFAIFFISIQKYRYPSTNYSMSMNSLSMTDRSSSYSSRPGASPSASSPMYGSTLMANISSFSTVFTTVFSSSILRFLSLCSHTTLAPPSSLHLTYNRFLFLVRSLLVLFEVTMTKTEGHRLCSTSAQLNRLIEYRDVLSRALKAAEVKASLVDGTSFDTFRRVMKMVVELGECLVHQFGSTDVSTKSMCAVSILYANKYISGKEDNNDSEEEDEEEENSAGNDNNENVGAVKVNGKEGSENAMEEDRKDIKGNVDSIYKSGIKTEENSGTPQTMDSRFGEKLEDSFMKEEDTFIKDRNTTPEKKECENLTEHLQSEKQSLKIENALDSNSSEDASDDCKDAEVSLGQQLFPRSSLRWISSTWNLSSGGDAKNVILDMQPEGASQLNDELKQQGSGHRKSARVNDPTEKELFNERDEYLITFSEMEVKLFETAGSFNVSERHFSQDFPNEPSTSLSALSFQSLSDFSSKYVPSFRSLPFPPEDADATSSFSSLNDPIQIALSDSSASAGCFHLPQPLYAKHGYASAKRPRPKLFKDAIANACRVKAETIRNMEKRIARDQQFCPPRWFESAFEKWDLKQLKEFGDTPMMKESHERTGGRERKMTRRKAGDGEALKEEKYSTFDTSQKTDQDISRVAGSPPRPMMQDLKQGIGMYQSMADVNANINMTAPQHPSPSTSLPINPLQTNISQPTSFHQPFASQSQSQLNSAFSLSQVQTSLKPQQPTTSQSSPFHSGMFDPWAITKHQNRT